MQTDFNKNSHPERQDNEVFITNTDLSRYANIGWKTKRKGIVAYTNTGNLISDTMWSGAFPVFAKKEEILKEDPKTLERLHPIKN